MRTDEELLLQAGGGDETAFEMLLERYRASIQAYIARMVANQSTADDLTQDVFLKVWTNAGQWDGRGSVKGWLYRIATNTCLNHLRTVKRRRETPIETCDSRIWERDEYSDTVSQSPEDALDQSIRRERVRNLLSKLPEDKQRVIGMVFAADMGIREAATMLGIPEGTVKSRLHYALRQLAKDWNGLNGEEED